MLGQNNKNYALYLAGVINEEQYVCVELDQQTQAFESVWLSVEKAVAKIDRLQVFIEENEDMSSDEKENASGVVDWFKNKLNSLKAAVQSYKEKGVHFINEKADKVLSALEKWAGLPEYQEEVEQIKQLAKQDAGKIHVDPEWIATAMEYEHNKRRRGNPYQMAESVLGSIGTFAAMTTFKTIRFVLTDILSVLVRTVINTIKQIATPEAQGLKFMINFLLAIMFPLIAIFGTGGSGFLIPAGLFYMTQLIKSIYQHITGQPYLYEPD